MKPKRSMAAPSGRPSVTMPKPTPTNSNTATPKIGGTLLTTPKAHESDSG